MMSRGTTGGRKDAKGNMHPPPLGFGVTTCDIPSADGHKKVVSVIK